MRAGPAPLAVAAAGLLAAGCGAAGGPSRAVGSTPASATRAAATAPAAGGALAYSACMRSHGLPRFPDPGGGSGGAVEVPKGVDPASAAFKAAYRACRSLLPASASATAPPDPQEQTALLAFARCMRAHGIPAFPDPTPDGGSVQRMPPAVDTHAPQFAAATRTCRRLVPGLFGG